MKHATCRICIVSIMLQAAVITGQPLSFHDDFASPTLDPAWQVVSHPRTEWPGYGPANRHSLTDNAGSLRYALDPMTHQHGFVNGYTPVVDPYNRYDVGLELHRSFAGDQWELETRAVYYMPASNGRQQEIRTYFGDGSPGTVFVVFYRDRDTGRDNLQITLYEQTGPNSTDRTLLALTSMNHLLDGSASTSMSFRLARDGGVLSAAYSPDGSTWQSGFTYDFGAGLDGVEQRVVIAGGSWRYPAGSYADYDYVSLTPKIPPPTADAGVHQNVFAGETVQLNGGDSVDPDGSGLTYAWSFVSVPAGSGAQFSDASASAPTFVPDLAGFYEMRLAVVTGNGGSDADTVTALATPIPEVAFADEFSAPDLDPAWFQLVLPRSPGNPSTTNRISLTDNPGHLRYLLDPMTHQHGFMNGYDDVVDAYNRYDVGLELHRGIAGDAWQLEAKVDYHMPPSNGRQEEFRVYFGDGEPGTLLAVLERDRDVNRNRIWIYLAEHVGPDPRVHTDIARVDLNHLLDGSGDLILFYRLERRGAVLTASYSVDGTLWQEVYSRDLGTQLDGLGQRLVINGGSWRNPAGSYSDYDYVRLRIANEPPVANAGPDQTLFAGETAQLDGSGSSDPDGDAMTYEWKIVQRPAGSTAQLSDPGAPNPTLPTDLPGDYVIELMVNDGFVSSAPDQVVLTAQTVQEAAEEVVDEIVDLVDAGEIQTGQGGALTSKIEAAIQSTDNGNTGTAINQLEAFINQVEAQRGKKISDELADELVAAAQAIIDNLAGGPAAKPAAAVASGLTMSAAPNPMNPETTISYSLAESGMTSLRIYNLLGQEVRTLVQGVEAAGAYRVRWDGRDASGREVTSGVYFARLDAGNAAVVRRMVVVK